MSLKRLRQSLYDYVPSHVVTRKHCDNGNGEAEEEEEDDDDYEEDDDDRTEHGRSFLPVFAAQLR